MEILLILLILLLVLGGGGWYTSRTGYAGPDVGGFLWVLCAVVVIILVVRLLGVV